jgi:hypothetical protein
VEKTVTHTVTETARFRMSGNTMVRTTTCREEIVTRR